MRSGDLRFSYVCHSPVGLKARAPEKKSEKVLHRKILLPKIVSFVNFSPRPKHMIYCLEVVKHGTWYMIKKTSWEYSNIIGESERMKGTTILMHVNDVFELFIFLNFLCSKEVAIL